MLRFLAKLILLLTALLFGLLLMIAALGMLAALVSLAVVGPTALPLFQREVLGLQYSSGLPVTTIQLFAMLMSAFVLFGFLFCLTVIAWKVARSGASVPAGKFDTYKVEPSTEGIGGVFKKDKDAKIHLWLTADERRLPVKVKSKVVVGSFVGELVAVEGT